MECGVFMRMATKVCLCPRLSYFVKHARRELAYQRKWVVLCILRSWSGDISFSEINKVYGIGSTDSCCCAVLTTNDC